MSTDAPALELPADLTQAHAMILMMQQQIQTLQRERDVAIARLLKKLYGRSSEKINPAQLLLFGERMEKAAVVPAAAVESAVRVVTMRAKPSGRRPLPAELPRIPIEHDLSEDQKTCQCCGQPMVRIGQEISEQLDYVPAKMHVLQHIRHKYACRHCQEGVVTAEKPVQAIEKALPGPGLLAHVAVSKYADHLPLYRLEGIYARHGVDLDRSVMCRWLKAGAQLLEALVERLRQKVRLGRKIHTDDTPVKVQDHAQRTGSCKTGRVWVYVGEEAVAPYIVYDYTESRSRDGPAAWLGDYHGYLQADAFGGYDGIYAGGRIVEAACWAHTRRYFVDAQGSEPARSAAVLALIQQLYAVEREGKELCEQDRLQLRRQRSLKVLRQIRQLLESYRPTALPKSPLGQAVQYTLNQWRALRRYTKAGYLSIDNNEAERQIRPITVGRKNYLFFGSDTGGQTAAVYYSLIMSCRRLSLDPLTYLREVLAQIASTPLSRLDELLPEAWKAQQQAAAPATSPL